MDAPPPGQTGHCSLSSAVTSLFTETFYVSTCAASAPYVSPCMLVPGRTKVRGGFWVDFSRLLPPQNSTFLRAQLRGRWGAAPPATEEQQEEVAASCWRSEAERIPKLLFFSATRGGKMILRRVPARTCRAWLLRVSLLFARADPPSSAAGSDARGAHTCSRRRAAVTPSSADSPRRSPPGRSRVSSRPCPRSPCLLWPRLCRGIWRRWSPCCPRRSSTTPAGWCRSSAGRGGWGRTYRRGWRGEPDSPRTGWVFLLWTDGVDDKRGRKNNLKMLIKALEYGQNKNIFLYVKI